MSTPPAGDILPANLTSERILSVAQGAQLYGISIATFRRLKRAGKLPPPLQLSERRIGWRVRDLVEHLKAQPVADMRAFRAGVVAPARSPGHRGRRSQQLK
jgi:predicted DNA-binding transcriptional regulator AlpA